MIKDILIGVSIGMLIVAIFTAGTIFMKTITDIRNNPSARYDVNITCEGNGTYDKMMCMKDFVNDIYIYNKTDDRHIKTLEELKITGGDCYDYAILYRDMAHKLNLSARMIIFENSTVGHAITIVWDDNLDYYIFDQTAAYTQNG